MTLTVYFKRDGKTISRLFSHVVSFSASDYSVLIDRIDKDKDFFKQESIIIYAENTDDGEIELKINEWDKQESE